MDNLTLRTTLGPEDWRALLLACNARAIALRKARKPGMRIAFIVAWVLLVATCFSLFKSAPQYFHPVGIFVGMGLLGFVVAFWSMFARAGFEPVDDGAILGTTTFEFDSTGFNVTRKNSGGRSRWQAVREIAHTPVHIFLWIDSSSAYVIRVADLPAPLTVEDVVARLSALRAAAAATSAGDASLPAAGSANAVDAPGASAPQPEAANPLPVYPSVAQELRALLRVEFRQSADARMLHGREPTLALLALVSLAAWIGLDRLRFLGNPDVEFFSYSLPQLAQLGAWALAVAWVAARASRPVLPLRRALLLVLAFSPLVIAALCLGEELSPVGSGLTYGLAIVWGWQFLLVGLRAMTGTPMRAAVAATLTGVLLIWLPSHFFMSTPVLWFAADPEYTESPKTLRDREHRMFGQALRIDADIAKMAPAPDAHPVAYFVGFAGYGEQRVFAEEIATAARVIGERYGTSARELRLVNDRRDEEKYAYASDPALKHALAGIGKRMRPDDVLFLAVSSHGDANATVSVSGPDYTWVNLEARELRSMLDAASIPWRVIVISACHAGSFIPALADERTIVLTAAAAAKTSFGCADDRDLTYFGEAFYRDALPAATSLRAAFDAARDALAKREQAEGREQSDPQASYGALLERKLAAMETH
jgi:hypothetical protein